MQSLLPSFKEIPPLIVARPLLCPTIVSFVYPSAKDQRYDPWEELKVLKETLPTLSTTCASGFLLP